jgi:hypothetical protein
VRLRTALAMVRKRPIRRALALIGMGVSAYAVAAQAADPLACRVLRSAAVTAALHQPVTQAPAAASPSERTSNCQWALTDVPQASVTLTIDRYPPAELEAAWQSALDTYLHAGRMVRGVGLAAMWIPKKWGTTGLLYVKSRGAVCVLSVPRSGARELAAAKSLARGVVQRLSLYNN